MEIVGIYLGHVGLWFSAMSGIKFVRTGIELKDLIGLIVWASLMANGTMAAHYFLWGIK